MSQTSEVFLQSVNPEGFERLFLLATGLERKIRCLLQKDIRVHIRDNIVQLFGAVETWYQKQQIQELVREYAPHYQIRNDVTVNAGTRK